MIFTDLDYAAILFACGPHVPSQKIDSDGRVLESYGKHVRYMSNIHMYLLHRLKIFGDDKAKLYKDNFNG